MLLANITTFPFEDTNDLIGFLNFSSEIGLWQTQIVRLNAIGGMSLDISTKLKSSETEKYITYDGVKPIIKNFLNTNQYLLVNAEIKLKYPDNLRHIMDINDVYSAFWLNCFSDSTRSGNSFASISYLETTKELVEEPITSWSVHVNSLYNDYQNSKY